MQSCVGARLLISSFCQLFFKDTELKVAILDLVAASVNSQPGMMELFLCVRPQKQAAASSERVSPLQLSTDSSGLHCRLLLHVDR